MKILVIAILAGICHTVLTLPVSQENISVTQGESFKFFCGPSNDQLDGIAVTLNNNEPSTGIVNRNGTRDDISFFVYRNTTQDDDGTRIVCSSGRDTGTIYLTVFYAPNISVNDSYYTIEEGKDLSIPLTFEANPEPDAYALLFQNAVVPDVYPNTTVRFFNIQRNQTGEYSIRISNNISESFFNFTIDVTYPPAFNDPILPSGCYPVGTNVTYNCSVESLVRGNPQPNVMANITRSEVNASEVSGDAVKISGGMFGNSVDITCTAINGVTPSATASGSVHFGRSPVAVENIQIKPKYKSVRITWNSQADTGCPQSVLYQGEVKQLDANSSIASFNTTGNLYKVGGLNQNTEYVVFLRAINELGTSSYVSNTTRTKVINVTITALDATIMDSNLMITWEYISDGVDNVTVTIIYLQIIDGTPETNRSYSADAADKTITLKVKNKGVYNITLHIVATDEENISDTKTMVVSTLAGNSISGTASPTKVLKLILTMTILVLACLLW